MQLTMERGPGNREFVAFVQDESLSLGVTAGERVYLVVWVDDNFIAGLKAERIMQRWRRIWGKRWTCVIWGSGVLPWHAQ